MDEIRVDYCMLGKGIEDLAVIYTGIVSEIKKLEENAATLDIFWDGDADNAYFLRINRDVADIKATVKSIRVLIKSVNDVLGIYMDNESKAQRVKEEILNGA